MANFNRPFGSDKSTPSPTPTPTTPSVSGVPAPSGTDKNVWAEAEASALGLNGGFAGIGKEGRKAQIQEQYDKMVESDKQVKEWAAGSGILGDTK